MERQLCGTSCILASLRLSLGLYHSRQKGEFRIDIIFVFYLGVGFVAYVQILMC